MSGISDTKKQEAIEHIRYEIGRLVVGYESLRGCSFLGPCKITNDQIEVVLLHSRALLDFFETTAAVRDKRTNKDMRDDILAEDFGLNPKPLGIAQDIRIRINKEVAHLTYSRCGKNEDEKRWPWGQFVPALVARSLEFLEHLLVNQSAVLIPTERVEIEKLVTVLSNWRFAE